MAIHTYVCVAAWHTPRRDPKCQRLSIFVSLSVLARGRRFGPVGRSVRFRHVPQAALRIEVHSDGGWRCPEALASITTAHTARFASPRGSALLRLGEWATRVSAGTGFFLPTVLTEETEAVGLSRLQREGRVINGGVRVDF